MFLRIQLIHWSHGTMMIVRDGNLSVMKKSKLIRSFLFDAAIWRCNAIAVPLKRAKHIGK